MHHPDDDGTAPSGVENPKSCDIPEDFHAVASPTISKKALAITWSTLSTVENSLIPKVAVTAVIGMREELQREGMGKATDRQRGGAGAQLRSAFKKCRHAVATGAQRSKTCRAHLPSPMPVVRTDVLHA